MNTNNWSEDDKLYKMRPMPAGVKKNQTSQLNRVFTQLIEDKFTKSLAEILTAITNEDCGEAYIRRIMIQAYDYVGVDYDEESCSFVGVRLLYCQEYPMIVIDCPRTVYWDDSSYICFVFYHGFEGYKLPLGNEVGSATFIMHTGEQNYTIAETYAGQETIYKITNQAMVEELIYYVKEIVVNGHV